MITKIQIGSLAVKQGYLTFCLILSFFTETKKNYAYKPLKNKSENFRSHFLPNN